MASEEFEDKIQPYIEDLLNFLYRSENGHGDESVDIKTVQDNLGMTYKTCHRIIELLVEEGFITKYRDGRKKVVELTEDGRTFAKIIYKKYLFLERHGQGEFDF